MIAALLLALPLAATENVVVQAAEPPPGRLASEFDSSWLLPPRGAGEAGLLPELEALVAARFEVTVDGETVRNLGDLVLVTGRLGRKARAAWLERFERRAPALAARHGEALRQLLLDDQLRSERWTGERDEERDGFLMGPPWKLPKKLPEPWNQVKVRPVIHQGVTIVRADLSTFKAVENDFRPYPDHRGARYDWIYPEAGRYFRGEDDSGDPVDTSLIVFRCDLPFPFSHYDCRVHVRNGLDGNGRLVCDVYSTSRDFHYLAGRDVTLPVRAGDGTAVGLMLVRDFGFDLDGVPDQGKHVTTALRRTLGNLKREAERRAARLPELGALEGQLPEFVMYGERD